MDISECPLQKKLIEWRSSGIACIHSGSLPYYLLHCEGFGWSLSIFLLQGASLSCADLALPLAKTVPLHRIYEIRHPGSHFAVQQVIQQLRSIVTAPGGQLTMSSQLLKCLYSNIYPTCWACNPLHSRRCLVFRFTLGSLFRLSMLETITASLLVVRMGQSMYMIPYTPQSRLKYLIASLVSSLA